jgi:DNA gyrase subunit A
MILYSKTHLQTSISYNQVALVDKTPTELGLKDAIDIYISHNIDCLIKETNFDLKKTKDRLHIVEGLLIALEDIDNVITLIKKSENSSAAKTALMEKYNLSEVQAKSILAMRLSSLAKLEKIELENEKKELMDAIEKFNTLLQSKELQLSEIKSRLEEIVKKYGDARRTELAQIEVKADEKEIATVIPKDVVVVTSKSGLIKKIPVENFKPQKRGGKGITGITTRENDFVKDLVMTSTHDYLMFFTNTGKAHKLKAYEVPEASRTAKGTPAINFLNMLQRYL